MISRSKARGRHDVERDFSSWHEFVSSASDNSRFAWTRSRKRSSHDSDASTWHGTKTWDEALKMASLTGWPEGRTMLQDSLAVVAPRPTIYPSLEFDVAGAFPCVPLYCAGDPSCMVLDPGESLRMSRPIVRIDYNHWISANVSPKSMMLRGAAVLSLADTLERRGISTELRIIGNSQEGKFAFRYSIVYKRAGEPLDIDRAAFAIAHPSSMRRLAFAILEQHKELEPDFQHVYGYPMHEPNDPSSETIFVPGSRGNETPASAKLAVEIAAKELMSGELANAQNVPFS